MATVIAIIVVTACCIACGYGISRAIRRSKGRQAHGEALQTR
jgi:ribosomal protein L37E